MAKRPLHEPDMVDRVADWGVTVSEARARKGPMAVALTVAAYFLVFAGAILVLPILAGVFLRFESEGLAREFSVVAIIATLGVALRLRASRLPRNALQIDYRAAEIRLGSERADGVFIRQRVAKFREIGEVTVGVDRTLSIELRGETVTLEFNGVDGESLDQLATQISAARESALRAPIRSRIQSRIMGFDASIREVKSRLTSRIA